MAIPIEKFKLALKRISYPTSKTDDKTPIASFSKMEEVSFESKSKEKRVNPVLKSLNSNSSSVNSKSFQGNIENFIGMASIPIGIAGPLLIKGQNAIGNFHIPLSTTEGALVASYSRGAKACSLSGGTNTYYIRDGVQRSPVFIFYTCGQAIAFQNWVEQLTEEFENITTQTSRFAQFQKLTPLLEGNQLILTFQFSTGDAAGQNMVTLCTQAICEFIVSKSPVEIKRWYIESNFSGDKKANYRALTEVRGRKVIAEVCIPKVIIEKTLKSTPLAMTQYFHAQLMATVQSGVIGVHGHYANGLTALFIATGQDVACVSEAAIGLTRMEITETGDLYCSVTLPNLIVGTVGGGTHLPTQSTCLELLDCKGSGKAKKFAEIVAATVLCGEISITAALAEGHFSRAHQQLGRPSGGRRL